MGRLGRNGMAYKCLRGKCLARAICGPHCQLQFCVLWATLCRGPTARIVALTVWRPCHFGSSLARLEPLWQFFRFFHYYTMVLARRGAAVANTRSGTLDFGRLARDASPTPRRAVLRYRKRMHAENGGQRLRKSRLGPQAVSPVR